MCGCRIRNTAARRERVEHVGEEHAASNDRRQRCFGARRCAGPMCQLRLTPLALGATLRIQDSLQEGRSRFYAEITRIREVADLSTGQSRCSFCWTSCFREPIHTIVSSARRACFESPRSPRHRPHHNPRPGAHRHRRRPGAARYRAFRGSVRGWRDAFRLPSQTRAGDAQQRYRADACRWPRHRRGTHL